MLKEALHVASMHLWDPPSGWACGNGRSAGCHTRRGVDMLILCRGCCRVSPLLLSMNGRAPMPRQRTGARAPTRGASEQKGRSVVVGARSSVCRVDDLKESRGPVPSCLTLILPTSARAHRVPDHCRQFTMPSACSTPKSSSLPTRCALHLVLLAQRRRSNSASGWPANAAARRSVTHRPTCSSKACV